MKVITVALIAGGAVAAALLYRRSGAALGSPLTVGPDKNTPPGAYDAHTWSDVFNPSNHVTRKEEAAPYIVSRVTGIPASSVKPYTNVLSKLDPSSYVEKWFGW